MELLIASFLALVGGALLGYAWRGRSSVSPELYQALKERLTETEAKLAAKEAELLDLHKALAAQETLMDGLREDLQIRERQQQKIEQQSRELWEQSARRLLEERGQALGEMQQNRLGSLLQPFQERLQQLEKHIESHYLDENRQKAELSGQIKQLVELNQQMSEEARQLTAALRSGQQQQGIWGEAILERILEQSGLQEGREYERQRSLINADGQRQQPDIILHLPQERHLIIDAKMSLSAYERYCRAESPEQSKEALKQHLQSVRSHVRSLSAKQYQNLHQLQTLDFVLLFLPVEPAFALVMQQDPELFNEAFQRNIILVSPSTLLATTRTIANLWRQAQQHRLAEEMARESGLLYDALVGHVEGLDKVEKRLQTSLQEMQSLQHRLSQGQNNLFLRLERLQAMGAKTSKQLPKRQSGEDKLFD